MVCLTTKKTYGLQHARDYVPLSSKSNMYLVMTCVTVVIMCVQPDMYLVITQVFVIMCVKNDLPNSASFANAVQ